MKKSLIALGLTLAISTVSAYAQPHHGPQHHHHQSNTTINLVIAAVDESNAINLQTQLETIEVLRADLGTLVDAKPQDQAAITVAHDALKLARDMLKTDIDALLANDTDLQETVRSQAEQEREDRHLVAMALRIDENFELLIAAATEEQAAQLVANQLALDATRQSIRNARETGADRSEIRLIREASRETFENQRSLAAEVIAANDELSAQLTQSSEAIQRPSHQKCNGKNKHS